RAEGFTLLPFPACPAVPALTVLLAARGRRPRRALVFSGDRSEPFVVELLHATPLISFRRIEVALRVDGDAVQRVPLTGIVAARAEVGQLDHRLAFEDVNALIAAIRDIQVFLRRVFR